MKLIHLAPAFVCAFLCTLLNGQQVVSQDARKAGSEPTEQKQLTEKEAYNQALDLDKKKNYAEAIKWFRKVAEQGHTDAQVWIGYYYEKGQGVQQDYAEAVKWYRKAAEQGNATGQCNLGYCYSFGKGVQQDYTESVKWYRKAAEQDYVEAQTNLGWCYEYGKGVQQDYTEAEKWYRKASEQGYSIAKNCLDNLLAKAPQLGKSQKQIASNENTNAARVPTEQKQLSADELLLVRANEYLKEGNYSEAVKWYHKAAEAGNASAQIIYGSYCFVEEDFDEAIKWYKKACEQGHIECEHMLGYAFTRNGHAASFDFNKAVAALTKTARQGDAFAQNVLGNYYNYDIIFNFQDGKGVTEPNYSEAEKWYLMAANQGYAAAQINLFNFYRFIGEDEKAMNWLKKACSQEDPYAELIRGNYISITFPMSDNKAARVFARSFFYLAAIHGNQDAVIQFCDINAKYDLFSIDLDEVVPKAQNGDPVHQFIYARYLEYKGYRNDALTWFQRAADQGYPAALYHLGKKYYSGEKSIQYYLAASKEGKCMAAINELQDIYEERGGDVKFQSLYMDFMKLYIPRIDIESRFNQISKYVLNDYGLKHDADAEYLLAMRILFGFKYRDKVVWKVDKTQAAKSLYKSAANGCEKAKEAIKRYNL